MSSFAACDVACDKKIHPRDAMPEKKKGNKKIRAAVVVGECEEKPHPSALFS